MSVPLTVAQTSGAGWRFCVHPASGRTQATASMTLVVREWTSRARFGRIEFKRVGSSRFRRAGGSGLDYLAGADACSANAKMLMSACDDGANALEVRVPAAAAGIVGVADHVAVLRPFAAEITLQCHVSSC